VQLVHRTAHPALRDHVRGYYGFTEETGGPLRRREGPGSSVVIVVSFEHEWRLGDALAPERPFERFTSFIAGMHDTAVLTEHHGRAEGMQVNLAPPAAARLFGIPMRELARTTVSFEEVFGSIELVERLAELRSWEARFDLFEDTFAAMLRDAPPRSPAVEWIWRRLSETHGGVRMKELCRELGWSRKRLVEQFREEVGLTPKTAARLIRLERAIELASTGLTWGEVAHASGYYDQSHLVNEVRAITGGTPTEYQAAA
jgi:AraC-like DNA-binding protein